MYENANLVLDKVSFIYKLSFKLSCLLGQVSVSPAKHSGT